MIKLFYLTHKWDLNGYWHSGFEWARVMAMKDYATFPQTAGLESHHPMQFNVISRKTLLRRSYFSAEIQSAYSSARSDWMVGFEKYSKRAVVLILLADLPVDPYSKRIHVWVLGLGFNKLILVIPSSLSVKCCMKNTFYFPTMNENG